MTTSGGRTLSEGDGSAVRTVHSATASPLRPPTGGGLDRGPQMPAELVVSTVGCLGQDPHHQVGPGLELRQLGAEQVTEPASDLVTGDRRPYGAGYHEPGPLRQCDVVLTVRITRVHVHHKTVSTSPATTPDHGLEVPGPPEPLVRREHGHPRGSELRPRGARAPWRAALR